MCLYVTQGSEEDAHNPKLSALNMLLGQWKSGMFTEWLCLILLSEIEVWLILAGNIDDSDLHVSQMLGKVGSERITFFIGSWAWKATTHKKGYPPWSTVLKEQL